MRVPLSLHNAYIQRVCVCVRAWRKVTTVTLCGSMSFCGSIVCTHVPESQDVSVRLCPVKSAVIVEFVSFSKRSPKVLRALPNAPI